MKRFFFATSWSTVAILAACGGQVTGSPTASSDACAKNFDAWDQFSKRCGGGGEDESNKSNYVASCQGRMNAPGSGYSDSYLNACNSALASSTSCDPFRVPGCEEPTGKLADGAACYFHFQCASRNCATTGSAAIDGGSADAGAATGISCGTCAPRVAENAACVSTLACMPGLVCRSDGTGGGFTCLKEVTIPPGGACSYTGPLGTNCATPTTCIPDANGNGTCGAPPKKGDKCSSMCPDSNLTCIAGTCQDHVALGGACTGSSDCQSTLYCDLATMLCAAPKAGKPGDPCDGSGSGISVKCDPGLGCRAAGGSAYTCVALKNKGEACVAAASDCAPYLDCIGGTCQVLDGSQCK